MKKSRFTDEQIAFALKQAETGTRIDEICLKMGISDATFYKWRQKYGALGPSELRTDRAGAGYGNCLGLAPQGCMLGVQRVGVRPPSS